MSSPEGGGSILSLANRANEAKAAWLAHARGSWPREMWDGGKNSKWVTVSGREQYLTFVQRQAEASASCHTSVNVCGTPSAYPTFWIDKMLLEIDGPNREASYEEMQRLYAFLYVNFKSRARVYFSGNRSFHLYVDFLPLALAHPEETQVDFAKRLQKNFDLHVDFNVFARRHLSRLPWTRHEKSGGYCLPVAPFCTLGSVTKTESAVPVEIAYSEQVRNALIRIDQGLSEPRPRVRAEKRTPASYGWIEKLLQHPISDGRHRVLWHVLAPFLINTKKLPPEIAEQVLREYFEKCAALKPLEPSRSQFLRDIRNYVRVAQRDGYPPWRLQTIERKDPQLFEIIGPTRVARDGREGHGREGEVG